MKTNEILNAFSAPFNTDAIEWRLQNILKNNDPIRGMAVPYIDSRAIIDRLNEVVGPFNWQNSFSPWHTVIHTENETEITRASQLCNISVYFEDRNEWVTKSDGAENSAIEPVKGGLSDAFKRSAVKWGIGRYLYKMNAVWVDVEKRGSSYVIKRDEYTRLNKIYEDAVAKIFKQQNPAPPKQQMPTQKPSTQQKPDAPAVNKVKDFGIYSVKSVKQTNGASGTNTQLEIIDTSGKTVKAYLKGVHEKLSTGTKLKNVKLEVKDGTYGKYNVINNYEIAA